jgi:hypothetical protein
MKLQKQTEYPKCPVLPHGGARRDSARNNGKTNWGKAGQYPRVARGSGRPAGRAGSGRVGSGRVTNISKFRGSGRVGSAVWKIEFFPNKLRYFCCMNCTTRSIRIQSFTIPDVNGNRCLLPAMFSAAATCKVITQGDQQSRWARIRSESEHWGPIAVSTRTGQLCASVKSLPIKLSWVNWSLTPPPVSLVIATFWHHQ